MEKNNQFDIHTDHHESPDYALFSIASPLVSGPGVEFAAYNDAPACEGEIPPYLDVNVAAGFLQGRRIKFGADIPFR